MESFKRKRETESITIDSFDVSKKEWIQLGKIQFEVTKQHSGKGGFRKAKLWVTTFHSKMRVWFWKSIMNLQRKLLRWVGNLCWSQTRKTAQIHSLSRRLAFAFERLCNNNFDSFRQSFSYNKIYHGLHGGEQVTIEKHIDITRDHEICQ